MVGPSPYGHGPEFSKPLRWRLGEWRDRLRGLVRRRGAPGPVALPERESRRV